MQHIEKDRKFTIWQENIQARKHKMTEVQSSNYDNKYQWIKLPIDSHMEHNYLNFLLFSISTVNM